MGYNDQTEKTLRRTRKFYAGMLCDPRHEWDSRRLERLDRLSRQCLDIVFDEIGNYGYTIYPGVPYVFLGAGEKGVKAQIGVPLFLQVKNEHEILGKSCDYIFDGNANLVRRPKNSSVAKAVRKLGVD